MKKNKKISKKFRGGGYFKQEEVMPGVFVLEMDGKGFVNRFWDKPKVINQKQVMKDRKVHI